MARTLAHISVPASLAGRSLHPLGYCSVFGAERRCRSPRQCCRHGFQDRCQRRLTSSSIYWRTEAIQIRTRIYRIGGPPRDLRFGKEEGSSGCGAFPALMQAGEAERSSFLLTWRSVKESNLLRLFSPATAFQADPLPFRQRCMFMAPNGGADPHGLSATHSFRNWYRSRPVSFGIWPRSKGSNLSPLGQSQMCCLYTRSVWCERRATIPHASLSTRV